LLSHRHYENGENGEKVGEIMPYIEQSKREKFNQHIDALAAELSFYNRPGEFNYVVSRLLWKIWHKEHSYTLGNNMIGALECIKAEFYRRFLAPYEDTKIEENGDIDL